MSSAVVIGAGLAGLFTAAALAESGYEVTVLERDDLGDDATARKGVPQGTQAHLMLMRGWQAAEMLLPGLREDVIRQGAARFASGRMPWLAEYGWLPTNRLGVELVTATRPLLELCTRRRVERLPRIRLLSGRTASGLRPVGGRWSIRTTGGGIQDLVTDHVSDVVVDASGRGSRLPTWLAGLGHAVPEPDLVDARLGYATRVYRPRGPLPLRTGVVIGATVETQTGGLALPVEHGRWLLMGGGYGERRPPRTPDGFTDFLAGLRDPVLAELETRLEPLGEVAVHRQTGNRRYRFENVSNWPAGLLAVGDSAAAFNPVYGQGISVAAAQAQLLRDALRAGARPDRRLQRRLSDVAELPWNIATGADLRQPSAEHRASPKERLFAAWTERLARSAAHGDVAATVVFGQLYHLTAPASTLFSPLLVGGVVRSMFSPAPMGTRPEVLNAISPRSPSTPGGDTTGCVPAAVLTPSKSGLGYVVGALSRIGGPTTIA